MLQWRNGQISWLKCYLSQVLTAENTAYYSKFCDLGLRNWVLLGLKFLQCQSQKSFEVGSMFWCSGDDSTPLPGVAKEILLCNIALPYQECTWNTAVMDKCVFCLWCTHHCCFSPWIVTVTTCVSISRCVDRLWNNTMILRIFPCIGFKLMYLVNKKSNFHSVFWFRFLYQVLWWYDMICAVCYDPIVFLEQWVN